MSIKKVDAKIDFVAEEHKVLEFWEKNYIFEKRRNLNTGKPRWSFIDGPITANNPMGVHHAWGRTLKDIYSIMGNRYISICKEISKLNEENYFGRISDVVSSIEKLSSIKGEYVVMVAKEGYGEK